MADRSEIERAIQAQVAATSNRVLNRNAISALFAAVSDPVGALAKVFLGRADALDVERAKIERQIILDLLCNIDDALKEAQQKAASEGVVVSGLIEIDVTDGDCATGIDIGHASGPVEFANGTRVSVTTERVSQTTGVRIGS